MSFINVFECNTILVILLTIKFILDDVFYFLLNLSVYVANLVFLVYS